VIPSLALFAFALALDQSLWLLVLLLLGVALVALALVAGRSPRFWTLLGWLGGSSLRAHLLAGRRQLLLQEPFPDAWERILRSNLGLYAYLDAVQQEQLHDIVRILVAEKEWTPCGSLQMSDEVRVTIAAAAAVLILAREHDYYAAVRSILVYPTTFEMPAEHVDESGLVVRGREQLLGQAWYRGPVILAWDEVLRDCRNPHSPQNVVFHEFAHQLDYEGASLAAAGQPGLRRFGQVMQAEFETLVRAAEHGRATLLDSYGAGSPAEFFAVATECFFGQPVPLQRRHPHLYRVLRDFYNQDPAARFLHNRA
jgi:Mlc titration factor MtfA (ptsG expression regulator)